MIGYQFYRRVLFSAVVLLLLGGFSLSAQEVHRTEISVDFRTNRSVLDTAYMNNAQRIQEIVDFMQYLQTQQSYIIRGVNFSGYASPEGSYRVNTRLAQRRMQALESLIRSKVDIPDMMILREEGYIHWDYLKAQIAASDLPNKAELLRILDEESQLVDYYYGNQIDARVLKIRNLDKGQTWNELHQRYFDHMRRAQVTFLMDRQVLVVPTLAEAPVRQQYAQQPRILRTAPETTLEGMDTYVAGWWPKWYVKTNTLALATGITNAAVEFDFAKHWSVALPVLYSAWNYFTETIKFRTFAVQPEVRYWFREDHHRWFVGAHASLAYYNVAVDGGYRYQDHGAESPTYGGGLAFGYRLPIALDGRLCLDFSLGAGVYALHYDVFHNTPDTKDGLMIKTCKQTYFGIDQVAVSLNYSFDLKKKGGKR